MELAGTGILVPFGALQQSIKQRESGSGMIAWLAIPTCARPKQLQKALQSYAANAAQFGGSHSFLVADDSPGSGGRRETKHAVLDLLATSPRPRLPLFYMGRPERSRYVRALCCKGDIPMEIARFALLGSVPGGPTYGANRNAILLHTQGSRILSADDDTSCVPGVVPGVTPGPRIHSHGDPLDLWFFPNRTSAFDFVRPVELNVAAEHGRLLGASLVTALDDSGICCPPLSSTLNDACSHMWLSLCAANDRILITTNGMAGDSGMADTGYAIRMAVDPVVRNRLASEDSYRLALRSREIVRQALARTISHTGPVMATCVGLDNRELLPPFCPVYRNEDGVFGRVLSQCFPNGYAAYLPFVLRHVPNERRPEPPSDMACVRFSQIVLACLSMWPGGAIGLTDSGRMRSIGQHLMEIGSLPIDDFFDFLRVPLRNGAAATIGVCEHLLSTYSPPPRDPWGEDLKRSIRQIQRGMVGRERAVPTDFVEDYPGASAGEATSELVRRYGELLYWWPVIVDRAKTLSAEGRTLAHEISAET